TIESVELIREAKINNLPVTAEVTPHHVLVNNENLDTSDGKYKMYPPIRTENDRLGLIAGLKDGTIDVISTDHAPHPKNDKVVNFKEASRGVVGLESSFPMLYSSKIFDLDDLVMFLDINPRKILSDIGYKINQMRTFEWKICDKEFYTISEPKNSLFEGNTTLIETNGIYV
ncbi:dihydroorotase, partial [Acidimicrobiia bacterium]|nr:dihydroorotase [Acidimicrobiia bacterium]